LYRFEF
jgi:hypothetical protein